MSKQIEQAKQSLMKLARLHVTAERGRMQMDTFNLLAPKEGAIKNACDVLDQVREGLAADYFIECVASIQSEHTPKYPQNGVRA